MLEQDKKTIEAEEQRAKEYAKKPVTKPISEPVPQKKKENISFWENLLNAFGDAGYSSDTSAPLGMMNQAISDDYRSSGEETITPVRDKTDSGRITHNDIDFTNASAVADAATVSDRVKEMISQGVPVSELNQYIQSASDNGLISDDSRRRLKYMNNSR